MGGEHVASSLGYDSVNLTYPRVIRLLTTNRSDRIRANPRKFAKATFESKMSQAVTLTNPTNKKATRITVRTALIGVGLVVLLALVEHKPSLPGNEEADHVLSPAFWYDRVTSPPDQAKYVAVITVGADMPANFPFESSRIENKSTAPKSTTVGLNSLEDPCKRRLYISQLLRVLPDFRPKAVVL